VAEERASVLRSLEASRSQCAALESQLAEAEATRTTQAEAAEVAEAAAAAAVAEAEADEHSLHARAARLERLLTEVAERAEAAAAERTLLHQPRCWKPEPGVRMQLWSPNRDPDPGFAGGGVSRRNGPNAAPLRC
jgi:hypothetical protein